MIDFVLTFRILGFWENPKARFIHGFLLNVVLKRSILEARLGGTPGRHPQNRYRAGLPRKGILAEKDETLNPRKKRIRREPRP